MHHTPGKYYKYLIFLLGVFCLHPTVDATYALLIGVALGLFLGNPYVQKTRRLTRRLLPLSIIGLGASMDLMVIINVGQKGLFYTALGIAFTLIIGRGLGRILKTKNDISWLITMGTAICGGSAIAALAPVIRAKDHSISVALAVIFILNALALFIFPWAGHLLNLSQEQFGLWSALAIHDTSSVVGAGLQYGNEALKIGTTLKLTRTLWIVPIVFTIAALEQNKAETAEKSGKRNYPWFILGFLTMAALTTWLPQLASLGETVSFIARRLLVLTLFLIGTGITREAIKHVGKAPFLQGTILWAFISLSSLGLIYMGWIS